MTSVAATISPTFSFLIHIMHTRELRVLDDWMAFLNSPPTRLIAVLGEDPALEQEVAGFCDRYGMGLEVVGRATPKTLMVNERHFLRTQFEAAGGDLCGICKLDTIPFRSGSDHWVADVLAAMTREEALFVTGSTLPYRADRLLDGSRYLSTKQFSLNFAFMRGPVWKEIQDRWEVELAHLGRFIPEGAVEHHCQVENLHGLRLVNTSEFRVFHTQEWGDRMDKVRARFKAGSGIDRYLKGCQDDFMGPNEAYYMLPKPPLSKRARVAAGQWRRKLIGER